MPQTVLLKNYTAILIATNSVFSVHRHLPIGRLIASVKFSIHAKHFMSVDLPEI